MIFKGLVIILLLCEQSFQDPLSPPKLDAKKREFLPKIPESLEDSPGTVPLSFYQVWWHRLISTKDSDESKRVPKTLLVPTPGSMVYLSVFHAAYPLDLPSYTQLTDEFILDSLSTQTIDFNDPQLTSPEGLTIKSMSGKDLVFKKDQQKDEFTVNGIDIKNHQKLPDGTHIIRISDFLFNFYDKFQKAFKEISFTHRGHGSLSHELDSEDHPPSGPETSLPEIPASFSSTLKDNLFLMLWEYRMSKLHESSGKIDSRVPVTILPVNFFKMVYRMPLNAPNPYYSDKYSTEAINFILDSLSAEKIDLEDPNLTTPEGVVIKTFSGKDLVFKKDSQTDKLTINDIEVETDATLEDGTSVFILSDFLFNHEWDYINTFNSLLDDMSRKARRDQV